MTRTRADRRHTMQRARDRARRVLKRRDGAFYTLQGSPKAEPTPAEVGRAARTPVVCSCWMCGNPRRKIMGTGVDRRTLQERRAPAPELPADECAWCEGLDVENCVHCAYECDHDNGLVNDWYADDVDAAHDAGIMPVRPLRVDLLSVAVVR